MITSPPVQVTAAPRRRLRKLLIFALLGVVLGLLVVAFLARIYNPFEEGIGDRQLLVLAPADADLLVFIPRVPKFLGELRDRPFSQGLSESERFQRFLRSDFAKKTGAVEALSSAFSELDLLRSRPPLGLDLWQDISGDALLFAGYGPAAEGQPWQFIAMFRPNSWKVIAAVNVLIDDVLGDLSPIRNGLEAAGVKKVERFRDSVTLTFAQGPAISLARIRNVIVVGTEVDRITRLKTTIERDRLPVSPDVRYADLMPGVGASAHEVRAVVRRRVADAQLHLTQRLNEKWGADNVSLLEATLPRFGGEDVLLSLSVDESLDLKIRMLEGAAKPNDIGRSFRRFDREDASVAFRRAAPLLPDSTFAFAHLKVDVMQFLHAFFQRPEIFSSADLANLAEALKAIKEIENLDGLKNKLAEICDGKTSIGFFKEDRDVLDKPAAGYFVAWHLQDEKQLRSLLDSVSATLRTRSESGQKSVVRDLVHTQKGGVDLYEIVVPAGVVDDPRVTKLGLVIGREVLIVTNFIPSFRPLMQAATIDERMLPAEATLDGMIERGPDSMRLGCAISGDAIYQYFDQAAEGWAVQQTTPTGRTEAQWNSQAEIDARARGLKDGTAEFKRFVDDAYQRKLDEQIKIARPQIRRDIERYLGDLRGVVSAIGFFIGDRDGLELGLRIELTGKKN